MIQSKFEPIPCDHTSRKRTRGMCKACYQRARYRVMPQAECHPDRKVHAGGLCRICYRAGKRTPRATCHPDSFHVAKGLCRKCYNDLPENKVRDIQKRRLRKYGLTEAEYQAFLDRQGGACAVCHIPEPGAVDHDHKTGEVRGILCISCNAALGLLRDNPDLLRSAIIYLEGEDV